MVNILFGKTKTIQANAAVTAASNASPILITTGSAHNLETGDIVQISGVAGNLAANGQFVVTVTAAHNFTLNGTNGSGTYTSAGTATHVGFATPSVAIDSSNYPTGANTSTSMMFRLDSIGAATNVRALFEEAIDANFLTALPGPGFGGNGPNALQVTQKADYRSFLAMRFGAAGALLRVRIYLSGGAGSTCTFSCWLQ